MKITSLSLSLKSLLLPMPQEIKMSGLLNNPLLAFCILSILDLKQILLSYLVSKKSISSAFISQSYLICATDNSFCFSVVLLFNCFLFPPATSYSLCGLFQVNKYFSEPLFCVRCHAGHWHPCPQWSGSFRGLPTGFKHAGRDENWELSPLYVLVPTTSPHQIKSKLQ